MSVSAVTSFGGCGDLCLCTARDHSRALPGEPGVSAVGSQGKSHASSCRWLMPPAVGLLVVVVVFCSPRPPCFPFACGSGFLLTWPICQSAGAGATCSRRPATADG